MTLDDFVKETFQRGGNVTGLYQHYAYEEIFLNRETGGVGGGGVNFKLNSASRRISYFNFMTIREWCRKRNFIPLIARIFVSSPSLTCGVHPGIFLANRRRSVSRGQCNL